MTHPHKDLIIALLDDPTLEVEMFYDNNNIGDWIDVTQHRDLLAYIHKRPERQFRLREKPKPDVVVHTKMWFENGRICTRPLEHWEAQDATITFTADGTLKNAEVL